MTRWPHFHTYAHLAVVVLAELAVIAWTVTR